MSAKRAPLSEITSSVSKSYGSRSNLRRSSLKHQQSPGSARSRKSKSVLKSIRKPSPSGSRSIQDFSPTRVVVAASNSTEKVVSKDNVIVYTPSSYGSKPALEFSDGESNGEKTPPVPKHIIASASARSNRSVRSTTSNQSEDATVSVGAFEQMMKEAAAREEAENDNVASQEVVEEERYEDEEEEEDRRKEAFKESRRKTASPSMLKMMLEMSDSDDESEEVERAISRGKAKAEKIIDVEEFLKQTGSARKNPSPSTKLYQQIKSTPLRSCISAKKKKKKRTTAKKSVVFGSPNAAEFDTLDPVKGGMTPLHKHVAKQMFRMDGHEGMAPEEDRETALNSTILATWEEEEVFGNSSSEASDGQSRRSSERRQSNIGLLYKNRPSLVPDSDDDRANLQGQFDEMAASPNQENSDDPNRTVELSTLKNLVADESMDDIDNSEIMQTEDHTVELGSLNDLIGNSPLIRTSSTKKKAPPSPHTAEMRVMSFERKRRPQTPASLASNTVELGSLSELAANPDDENRTADPGVVSAMLKDTPQSIQSSIAEQTVALGNLQELVDADDQEDTSELGDELEPQHTVELGQLSELARSNEQRRYGGSRGSNKRKLSGSRSGRAGLSSGRSKKSRETPQSKGENVALHLSFSTMSTGSHSTHKDSLLAVNAIENFLDTPSTQASSMSEHVKTPEVLARLKAKNNTESRLLSALKSDEKSSSSPGLGSPIAARRSLSPLDNHDKPNDPRSTSSKRLSVSSQRSRRSTSSQRHSSRKSIESQASRSAPMEETAAAATSPSPQEILNTSTAGVKASPSASPSAMTSSGRRPSPIARQSSASPQFNGESQETEVVNASPVANRASSSSPLLMPRSPVRESSEDDEVQEASMREAFHHNLEALRAKLIAIQELMGRYNEFYNMSVTISEQLSVITSFEEKGKELKREVAVLDSEVVSVRKESEVLLNAHRQKQNATSQGMKLLQSRCLALELCPKLSLYQLKNISANAIVFALTHTDYELKVRLAPGETTPRIVKFDFRPTGNTLLGKKRKHCAAEVESGYEECLSAVVNATLEDTGKKLIGMAASDLNQLIPRLNQSTLRVMNLWEEIAVLCMSRPITFEVKGVSLMLKFDIVDIPKEVFVKAAISVRVDRYPCGFGACKPTFEVMAGKNQSGLIQRLERVTALQLSKLQPLSRQCAQIEEIIRNH